MIEAGGDDRRARRGTHGRAVAAVCLLAGLAMAACAQTHVVEIRARPEPFEVYVDGKSVTADDRANLKLRADRPHVLLIKREGYRTQQIVIESRRRDGRTILEPDYVDIELTPLTPKGRKLQVELDE